MWLKEFLREGLLANGYLAYYADQEGPSCI